MDNQIKCVVLTEDEKVLYRKEDSNGTGSLYLMDEGAVSVYWMQSMQEFHGIKNILVLRMITELMFIVQKATK